MSEIFFGSPNLLSETSFFIKFFVCFSFFLILFDQVDPSNNIFPGETPLILILNFPSSFEANFM